MPKFSAPIITISAIIRELRQMKENTVTKEIENAISSMENVNKITASSMKVLRRWLLLNWNEANVDLVLQDAQRKVNAILSSLPDDVKTPSLGKFSLICLLILAFRLKWTQLNCTIWLRNVFSRTWQNSWCCANEYNWWRRTRDLNKCQQK